MSGQMTNTVAKGGAYRLQPDLDLEAAIPLALALRGMLPDGPIHIDGDAVERAMTPCLQLLAAAAATARAADIVFRLDNASPALAEAIADLGLTAALGGEK